MPDSTSDTIGVTCSSEPLRAVFTSSAHARATESAPTMATLPCSEWAARSDAEKAEFSDLLKQLVRKSYERNLKKTLNFNIEYVSEKAEGAVIIVTTKAVSKTNAREEPIEIAFKMQEKDGVWRVADIVTEGVSLVSSYRSQFTKIVKKDGFPTLIKKMKDKIAKGEG